MKATPYSKPSPAPHPTELQEQLALAGWLDLLGLVWLHIPNELMAGARRGAVLKRAGVKSGAPDVLIFSKAPANGLPTAIELKRRDGGRVSPKQVEWLGRLAGCGVNVRVCHGAAEAVGYLKGLGYGV